MMSAPEFETAVVGNSHETNRPELVTDHDDIPLFGQHPTTTTPQPDQSIVGESIPIRRLEREQTRALDSLNQVIDHRQESLGNRRDGRKHFLWGVFLSLLALSWLSIHPKVSFYPSGINSMRVDVSGPSAAAASEPMGSETRVYFSKAMDMTTSSTDESDLTEMTSRGLVPSPTPLSLEDRVRLAWIRLPLRLNELMKQEVGDVKRGNSNTTFLLRLFSSGSDSTNKQRITLMNTTHHFRSMGLDRDPQLIQNPFLSHFVTCLDVFLQLCEGRLLQQPRNNQDTPDSFFDRISASTTGLLMIANAFLLFTYMLHRVAADFFLGPPDVHQRSAEGTALLPEEEHSNHPTPRQRRVGREHLTGYLLFKVLLISSVVEPDTLDLFVLLVWYAILSLLRSLCHAAGSSIQEESQSGKPPPHGAIVLLWGVLVGNSLAVGFCGAIFGHAGWNVLLLLTADCAILAIRIVGHVVRHLGATLEERHRGHIAMLEEQIVRTHDMMRRVDRDDLDAIEQLEEESRRFDREVEENEAGHARCAVPLERVVFALELSGFLLTSIHLLHIWSLHGTSFGLVNGVLLLQVQSSLSSAWRKVSERRNLTRILREIDEAFNDASDLDVRKASTSGDVCCICLVTMTTGNVKKVGCGHLFHKNCLREVVERARSLRATKCPLCRASLLDGTHSPLVRQSNVVDTDAIGVVLPQLDGTAQVQAPTNEPQTNPLVNEQSLFRFSTEGILPAWIPVPAFAFEVVRRETAALAEQTNGNAGGLQRFFRRGGEAEVNNGIMAEEPPAQDQQQQPSFWRRLFVLAGAIPMSPEEEAAALEQLVDMFPQYDRGDLGRELRARGSSEAVVESILLGVFSGSPRGAILH